MSEFICPIKCDSFGCDEELCPRYKAYKQGRADGFQEALTSNGINIYVDKIEADGARKFAEKIKSDIEKYWYQSELDMGAENVNSLIDYALAEWQKGEENEQF